MGIGSMVGFVVGSGLMEKGSVPIRRRGRTREGGVGMNMALSGFLTEMGDYPVVPGVQAPPLPRKSKVELGDLIELTTVDGDRGVRMRQSIDKACVVAKIERRDVVEIRREFNSSSQLIEDAERVLGLRRSFWTEERRVVGDWRLRLAIRLLVDVRTNSTGSWYYSILPSTFECLPVFWTRDEVLEVQQVELQLRILRQKIQWEKICELVRANSSTLDPREVLWAMSIVRSRAFIADFEDRASLIKLFTGSWLAGVSLPLLAQYSVEASIVGSAIFVAGLAFSTSRAKQRCRRGMLLPIADLMNHSGKSTTLLRYDASVDAFVIRAREPLRKGDELFISYNRPNDELLQFYGFVEKDNPYDRYLFCDTLNQFFNQTRFPQLPFFDGGKVSQKLLNLRSLSGGGVELSKTTEGGVEFNPVFLKVLRKVLSNEKEVQKLLREVCVRELDRKPTTIEEDETILSLLRRRPESSQKKILAVQYRLLTKRLLRKGAEQFSQVRPVQR